MDAFSGVILVAIVVFVVAILIGRAIVGWWFKIDESLAELKAMHAALDIQTEGMRQMYAEMKAIRGFFMPNTIATPPTPPPAQPAAPPHLESAGMYAPRQPKG